MGRKTKRKFGYVPPPARPPLALDAAAFPHLLDLVISFATPAAQLSLSQTCRALRSRLAGRLYAHIVVSDSPPSCTPDDDMRDELDAALDGADDADTCANVLVCLPCGRRVLARDIAPLPNPDIPFDRALSRLLSRARVVTFLAPIPPALADSGVVLARHAATLRLVGGNEYPRVMGAAGTLVVFHSVVMGQLGQAATAAEVHVPHGTRRVVLNYAFDAAAAGPFPVDVLALPALPESVEEVVVVFDDKCVAATPEPLGEDALWKSYLLNAATGGTAEGMFASLERGVRWVFVDCAAVGSWIEAVIKDALESFYSAAADEEIAYTSRFYDATADDDTAQWKLDIRARCALPIANASFVSLEGYRRYVGDEQFTLDTQV
ncbi:uncharacterized protein LOC62_07G009594 [Vanrija pseudolonga]|uniref:Uncharacterized protein n=1 Tax=Vanrija pseudolonga TaxID=143232 RepID=A0AAF0YFV1_9TREE|nr:hypothetical protein LOC62_07G009594 [Vanrija pseudolonga]